MSPPAEAIPRDECLIENAKSLSLVEVKLSNSIVVTRPDPNPWREAIRLSSAADPSPRPTPPPTFSLFDTPESPPDNNDEEQKDLYWWIFGSNLRFSNVGTSILLHPTLLIAWRVLIFALALAAAIVTAIFAPHPKAFLLPVSNALLAAISVRMIDLAAKKDDDASTPKFTYSIDAALYRAAQIVAISAGSHLVNIFHFSVQYSVTIWLSFLLTIACVLDIWFSSMPCSLASATLAFIVDMILVIFTVYLVNDGTLNKKSFAILAGVSLLVTMSFCLYNNAVYYCFHKDTSRDNSDCTDVIDGAEKV